MPVESNSITPIRIKLQKDELVMRVVQTIGSITGISPVMLSTPYFCPL